MCPVPRAWYQTSMCRCGFKIQSRNHGISHPLSLRVTRNHGASSYGLHSTQGYKKPAAIVVLWCFMWFCKSESMTSSEQIKQFFGDWPGAPCCVDQPFLSDFPAGWFMEESAWSAMIILIYWHPPSHGFWCCFNQEGGLNQPIMV
jgi:hypothetical protein